VHPSNLQEQVEGTTPEGENALTAGLLLATILPV